VVFRRSTTDRLDEHKLTTLRRWGEGLTHDDREEVRAAGRAILLLSDEIERLHIDLWHAQDQRPAETEETPPSEEPTTDGDVGTTLRDRLTSFRLSSKRE
jgi:hypothetical protein